MPTSTWIESQLTYVLFWFGLSISLCLLELFLPKSLIKNFRFVPLTTGICALLGAIYLLRANSIRPLNIQIAYWMGLSTACVIWIRPMFIQKRKHTIPDFTEAITLTEIIPGKTGEVIFEGAIWQASCGEYKEVIPANQTVYVLRRQGNTLIVVSQKLFSSEANQL